MSEVNCKASPKYYFRNDALYVALTTTSTTTTTIAPPVTQPPYNDRPLRPRRPLQRPRRPVQPADYYDDDEYEQDDYVEEQRYTRRRNQPLRGRTRRPQQQQQQYDDDYDGQQPSQQAPNQGRRFADDANDRRPNRNRNPSAYEYDDDEDVPRQRNRNGGRRRNQQAAVDDRFENAAPQRPAANGQRNSEAPPSRRKQVERPQRTKPQRYDDVDEADYDDRPAPSQNRYADDDAPKVSPSGGGSALFSRPRAPPRINRPVPLSDKRKYEYGASKSAKPTTTTSRPVVADDGYETEYEDDYQDAAPAPVNSNTNDRSTTLTRDTRRPAAIVPKKPAGTPAPVYEDEDPEDEEPPAPQRTQFKQAASSTQSRKVQSRPAPPPVVVESRQKQRVPLVSTYSDEQEDDLPQPPRPKISRRPAPAINAYSDEDETIAADEEPRAPVVPQQRIANQRPRIIQSRPLASGESRSFPRKTAQPVAEIFAEDDDEDVAEIAGPIVPVAPASRQSNRHNSVRPRVNTPPPAVQLPEDARPVRRYEESIGSSKFRQQFRTRDQTFRSTTPAPTSTTASPLDDSDYASDEYEDDEPIVAAPPAATEPPAPSPPPQRSALSKSQHRFAAAASANVDSNRPSVSKLSGKFPPSGRAAAAAADTSDEYFEPATGEGTAPALDSMRPQMVRVVKRPFLPSRGGNPYLPRGLKPLGPVERDGPVYAEDEETTGAHLDLGPTISGAKLLEFHPPLVSREPVQIPTTTTSTTTARPPPSLPVQEQHLDPNRKLEEIFSSELDVTLNDALNPTLKPLSRSSPIGFSFKYSPSYYEPAANRRDSEDAAADLAQQTQIHSSAIHAPFYGTTAGGQSRSAPMAAASVADSEFYEGDYDY